MPILYVKDSNGNFVAVPSIIGPRGPQGQGLSAYDAAKEAGYTGTEDEFNAALASISDMMGKPVYDPQGKERDVFAYVDDNTVPNYTVGAAIGTVGHWYRVGVLNIQTSKTTVGHARIIIGSIYGHGQPTPTLIDVFLKYKAASLVQFPSKFEPKHISKVRLVTIDAVSVAVDVCYAETSGTNPIEISVQPTFLDFTSGGYEDVTDSTEAVAASIDLTADGFMGALDPNNLTAPVPIEKGGTGAASAADARTALSVPSTDEMTTAITEATVDFVNTDTMNTAIATAITGAIEGGY